MTDDNNGVSEEGRDWGRRGRSHYVVWPDCFFVGRMRGCYKWPLFCRSCAWNGLFVMHPLYFLLPVSSRFRCRHLRRDDHKQDLIVIKFYIQHSTFNRAVLKCYLLMLAVIIAYDIRAMRKLACSVKGKTITKTITTSYRGFFFFLYRVTWPLIS